MPGGLCPTGTVPTPGRVRYFDQKTTEAINGDDGGTWNPQRPIVLVGPHAILVSATGSSMTGGVRTGRGSIALRQSVIQYPTFSPARTRNVFIPFGRGHTGNTGSTTTPISGHQSYDIEPSTGGVRCIEPFNSTFPGPEVQIAIPGRRLHNAGTLSTAFSPGVYSVALVFKVPVPRDHLPTSLPSFAIHRIDSSGNAAGLGGFLTMTPADPIVYHNNGQPYLVPYPVVSTGGINVIDTLNYNYVLRYIDEDDTGTPRVTPTFNVLMGLLFKFSSISTQKPE